MSLREGASAMQAIERPMEAWPAPVVQALQRLAAKQKGPGRHRQPVAVIGPGDANEAECAAAVGKPSQAPC